MRTFRVSTCRNRLQMLTKTSNLLMSFRKFGTSHSMEFSLENRKFINPYIQRMADYGHWVLSEDDAKKTGGRWAQDVFKTTHPVHVEIGTGNGNHFAHYAQKYPHVSLVGFEIKFKTLVQSISRARSYDCTNARMVLGTVKDIRDYFGPNEVEKIIIHFPDPWPKTRQQKNRLMQADFLNSAYSILKPGGVLEFKTDHHGYFRAAAAEIRKTPFTITGYTEDLHRSAWAAQNFKTQFENLFAQRKQAIAYFSLRKSH